MRKFRPSPPLLSALFHGLFWSAHALATAQRSSAWGVQLIDSRCNGFTRRDRSGGLDEKLNMAVSGATPPPKKKGWFS